MRREVDADCEGPGPVMHRPSLALVADCIDHVVCQIVCPGSSGKDNALRSERCGEARLRRVAVRVLCSAVVEG